MSYNIPEDHHGPLPRKMFKASEALRLAEIKSKDEGWSPVEAILLITKDDPDTRDAALNALDAARYLVWSSAIALAKETEEHAED